MISDPDMHDLAQQIIRLDGAIKTSRAENDAMESRIEARLASMEANMAHWKTDMAQRDKDNQRWTITLVLGCTALVIGAVALFS